jgi:hypothetical protein
MGGAKSAHPPATRGSALCRFSMMFKLKGVAMNIRRNVASGFMSALCLGILLDAMLIPAQAGDGSVQLVRRNNSPSETVQPGVPQGGRPLYSPPVFMDRSSPMSERPFAKPFIDRGPSVSERPLPPIGGGVQVAPGSAPFIWCGGQWVRVHNPWHGCPSR